MKSEIDKDFYCSGDHFFDDGLCAINDVDDGDRYECFSCLPCENCRDRCGLYHRKYPTPEQFKEEYGWEWEGACYFLTYTNTVLSEDGKEWVGFTNRHEKIRNTKGIVEGSPCVCACTPLGKPDADWRPK